MTTEILIKVDDPKIQKIAIVEFEMGGVLWEFTPQMQRWIDECQVDISGGIMEQMVEESGRSHIEDTFLSFHFTKERDAVEFKLKWL